MTELSPIVAAGTRIDPISADSHIVEPPHCYVDFIDPAYRERAPRIVEHPESGGEKFFIEGFPNLVGLNSLAAAGKAPEDIRVEGDKFSELHRSGWDPKFRLVDMDRDGVAAEFIYPTIGMLICNLQDADYKHACMQAYNRWLETYVAEAPDRIYGLGQTAVRSVEEAIADFRAIKDLGFKGVMMPGYPATEFDYDDPRFDPLWQASVEMGLPVSFHILTARTDTGGNVRGTPLNFFQGIIRGCQDIIGMFIYGGVFDRNPDFRLVCVEADAGWAPHYMYRMDHAYKRHRFWRKCAELSKMPSDYFLENVYLTFQDDYTALRNVDQMNPRRLMWASDFPHSDSTWPWSQDVIAEQFANLTEDQCRWILRDNVRELYKLD
jgi:predicted TIM-barrel fold metal-dependent hydrolase